MSQRASKRYRKEVRRIVNHNFGVGMEALSHIIRPKPKLVPRWLWVLAYVPLFPRQYLPLIYKYMK